MANKYYPHLGSPIKLGNRVFKNRLFGSPMSTPVLQLDNSLLTENIDLYDLRTKGGIASQTIAEGIVHPTGQSHTQQIALHDPMVLPSLTDLASAIHRNDCMASMELSHGGKYAGNRVFDGKEAPKRYGPSAEVWADGTQVYEMTEEMILEIADSFGKGAALAKQAGFDMVFIHAGHGWLLCQFMSPDTNRRTDKWGGSLENRMRLPLLVIEKVREAVGPGFPIEYRMSGAEYTPNGYGIEEAVEMAKLLDGKVDLIQVSAGVHENRDAFVITHPSMFIEHGCNVHLAAEIKKHIKTPVATLGGLNDPDMMEEIIASGKADVIEMARQLFSDPYFADKAFSGRAEDITKCCRCFSCFGGYMANRVCSCALNPAIGNERRVLNALPATTPKKVLIAGGGPGGMSAALQARERGHEVILFEKGSRLGGALLSEEYVPFKADLFAYTKLMAKRLAKAGVDIRLNTELTADLAESLNPDALIIAVGAHAVKPPIPGIDRENVVGLEAIHQPVPAVGQKVVILGGGLIGSESAIYLDSLGKDVTVVEMRDDFAVDASEMHKIALEVTLRDKTQVKMQLSTKAKAITDEGVVCEGPDGKEVVFPADTFFVAAGVAANQDVVDALRYAAPKVFAVGDCVKPATVKEAVTNGFFAASSL